MQAASGNPYMGRKPQVMYCIFQRGKGAVHCFQVVGENACEDQHVLLLPGLSGHNGSSRWWSPPPPAGTQNGVKKHGNLSGINHVV